MEKRYKGEEKSDRRETGVLVASGLIAGAAVIGVINAAFEYFDFHPFEEGGALAGIARAHPPATEWGSAAAAFLVLGLVLVWKIMTSRAKG